MVDRLVVVDSGGANLSSVIFALERLGIESHLTDSPREITEAEKVILPGVGTAGQVMENLRQKDLVDCIKKLTQPVLGICVGMQILFDRSEEGGVECLGLLEGKVERIPLGPERTVPHMGWNQLEMLKRDHPLLEGIEAGHHVYFIHSFYAPPSKATVATTDYGIQISALVERDNFAGCQFHPERSGKVGAKILENFCK